MLGLKSHSLSEKYRLQRRFKQGSEGSVQLLLVQQPVVEEAK